MLARKNLIPLRKEFGRIRAEAKNYDSPSFGLLISYGAPNTQASFIVSKKIHKNSVVRHDVKRKLSDAIEFFFPRLPKNIELVFLAKQKCVGSTREELKNEIQKVFERARLIAS